MTTGYNDVLIPQSRIAISKLSLYPERFTEDTGIIDSIGSNRNKEDIVISRIVKPGWTVVRAYSYSQGQLNFLEPIQSV